MHELLPAEVAEARRRVAERRAKRFVDPQQAIATAIDAYYLEEARRRASRQPRADLTIPQLPAGTAPQAADLFPIYRAGTGLTENLSWAQMLAGLPTITSYPSGSPAQNTDLVPISRGGVQETVTAQSIAALFSTSSSRIFNIVNYGAVGDGATICNTAIANAIAACHAAGGGVVYFPSGLWRITGPISLAGVGGGGTGDFTHGIAFVGDGMSSVIYPDGGSYDIFSGGAYGTPSNSLVNFIWRDLKVLVNGTMTGGSFMRIMTGVNLWYERLDLQGIFHAFNFGDSASNSGTVATCFINNVNCYNMSGDFLRVNTRQQQFFVKNCMVTGSASSYAAGSNYAINCIYNASLLAGFDLIDMQDCDFESMGGGFNFAAANANVTDSYFAGIFFDGTTNECLLIEPGPAPGAVSNTRFVGCVFWGGNPPHTTTANAVSIQQSGYTSGPTTINDIEFVNCYFFSSVNFALQFGPCQDVSFFGCHFAQSAIGIYVNHVNALNLSFYNCFVGDRSPGGGNTIGLEFGKTSLTGFVMQGCVFSNNATTLTDNTTSKTRCNITNNPGLNPFGVPSNPAQPAFPATTVGVANPYPTTAVISLTNGTGSLTYVITGGTYGNTSAVTVAASTLATIVLPPGASIVCTYGSGSPSWIWTLL